MRVSDPLNALSHALSMARHRDLPPVPFTWKGKTEERRPRAEALDVRLFMQSWSSTALGFDLDSGLAGQAFTTAPTVVVMHERSACVYFGECLAYRVPKMTADFLEDMKSGDVVSQSEAAARYGAQMPAMVEAEIA